MSSVDKYRKDEIIENKNCVVEFLPEFGKKNMIPEENIPSIDDIQDSIHSETPKKRQIFHGKKTSYFDVFCAAEKPHTPTHNLSNNLASFSENIHDKSDSDNFSLINRHTIRALPMTKKKSGETKPFNKKLLLSFKKALYAVQFKQLVKAKMQTGKSDAMAGSSEKPMVIKAHDFLILYPKTGIKYIWDIVVTLCLAYYLIIHIVKLAYDPSSYSTYNTVSLSLQGVFIVDLILHFFFIPRQRDTMGKWITNRKEIMKGYLKNDFIFDFIPFLPLFLIQNYLFYLELIRIRHLQRLNLHLQSILKKIIYKITFKASKALTIYSILARLISYVFIYAITAHILTCLWILISDVDFHQVSSSEYYLDSLFFVLNTLVTTGNSIIVDLTLNQMLCACLITICGAFLISYSVTTLKLISKNTKSILTLQEHKENLECFIAKLENLSTQRLAKVLKLNFKNLLLFSYYNDYQTLQEHYFFYDLGYDLSNELINNLLGPVKKKFSSFFKNLNEDFANKLVLSLRCKVYLANEVVIENDHSSPGIFFIYSGLVYVKMISGMGSQTVFTLKTGSFFGEDFLIAQKPQFTYQNSNTTLKILFVSYEVFTKFIDHYIPIESLRSLMGLVFKRRTLHSIVTIFFLRVSIQNHNGYGNVQQVKLEKKREGSQFMDLILSYHRLTMKKKKEEEEKRLKKKAEEEEKKLRKKNEEVQSPSFLRRASTLFKRKNSSESMKGSPEIENSPRFKCSKAGPNESSSSLSIENSPKIPFHKKILKKAESLFKRKNSIDSTKFLPFNEVESENQKRDSSILLKENLSNDIDLKSLQEAGNSNKSKPKRSASLFKNKIQVDAMKLLREIDVTSFSGARQQNITFGDQQSVKSKDSRSTIFRKLTFGDAPKSSVKNDVEDKSDNDWLLYEQQKFIYQEQPIKENKKRFRTVIESLNEDSKSKNSRQSEIDAESKDNQSKIMDPTFENEEILNSSEFSEDQMDEYAILPAEKNLDFLTVATEEKPPLVGGLEVCKNILYERLEFQNEIENVKPVSNQRKDSNPGLLGRRTQTKRKTAERLQKSFFGKSFLDKQNNLDRSILQRREKCQMNLSYTIDSKAYGEQLFYDKDYVINEDIMEDDELNDSIDIPIEYVPEALDFHQSLTNISFRIPALFNKFKKLKVKILEKIYDVQIKNKQYYSLVSTRKMRNYYKKITQWKGKFF